MTNNAFSLDVHLWTDKDPDTDHTYIAQLTCVRGTSNRPIGIRLVPYGPRGQLNFTRSMLCAIEDINEAKLSQMLKRDWVRITIQDDRKDRSNEGIWTFPLQGSIHVAFKPGPYISIYSVSTYEAPRCHANAKGEISVGKVEDLDVGPFSLTYQDDRDMVALVHFAVNHYGPDQCPGSGCQVRYLAALTYSMAQSRCRVSLDIFANIFTSSTLWAGKAIQYSKQRPLPSDYASIAFRGCEELAGLVVRLMPMPDQTHSATRKIAMLINVTSH